MTAAVRLARNARQDQLGAGVRPTLRIECPADASLLFLDVTLLLAAGCTADTSIATCTMSTRGRAQTVSVPIHTGPVRAPARTRWRRSLPDGHLARLLLAARPEGGVRVWAAASRVWTGIEESWQDQQNSAPPAELAGELGSPIRADGTPDDLQPLVSALVAFRESLASDAPLPVDVMCTDRDLPARAAIDVLGAIQSVPGVELNLGWYSDSRPLEPSSAVTPRIARHR